jgi:hypothetical protein
MMDPWAARPGPKITAANVLQLHRAAPEFPSNLIRVESAGCHLEG